MTLRFRSQLRPIHRVASLLGVLAIALMLAGSSSFAEPASDATAQIESAKRLANDGKIEEAIRLLDSVIASIPEAGDRALFQKGLILFQKARRFDPAIQSFRDLVRLYPDSRLCDDAMYYAGFVAQFHLRNSDLAVELYRSGYVSYPNGDYRFAIADKLRELTGANPDDLEAAVRANPRDTTAPPAIPGLAVESGRGPAAEARRTPPETDVPETSPFRPRGARTVTMQFDKAPLRTFVQWVAQVTGRNFIVDDDVQGEITVYSGSQVPFTEVYRVFLSILEVKGFAAVESDNVTKIVSRAIATQSELPIVLDDEADVPTDRLVTRLFRIRTVSATSMQTLLRPFLQSTDQIAISAEANSLIVSGPGANIARLAELIRLLDAERTPISVASHRIRHAKASSIAEKLTNIIASAVPSGATPPTMKIVSDERTNVIYVLGDVSVQSEVLRLLPQLDVDRNAERIIRVYTLGYARADDVVRQLKSLLGLDAVDAAPDYGGIAQTVLITDPRLNAFSLATFAPRVASIVDSFVSEIDRPPSDALRAMKIIRLQNAQAVKLAETLTKIYGGAATTGATPTDAAASGLADRVIITADERTNSLLVTATAVDWMKLEKVIRDLDVRKTQVLIDAVVLETNLDEARALGASIMSAEEPRANSTIGFGRSDPVGFLPTYQALVAQGGLTVGAVRGSIVAAMLNALLTSAKTNVLQMPQILALDNEFATLSVGNLTPIVTSRSVSADNVQIGGNSSIFQNVEYRNIGLNLKIKPHIGDRGDILIESRIEIQNRNQQAEAGLNLPVFTTREIEQQFQISNGDYIVLGGLLRTQDDYLQRETPWLSRIPLLGTLFKYTRTTESKTVLLIFLRPRIVTDPEEAAAVSEEERLQFEVESRTRPGGASTETDKWLPPGP